MLTLWIIPVLVGFVSAQSSDPSCLVLKTTLRADDCCEIPDVVEDSIYDQCIAEVGEANLVCIEECIAKKIGVLKNKIMDKNALAQLLTNTLGKDSNFGPIIGGVFERCYTQMLALPTVASKCDSQSTFIMNCVDSELFQNCPAKLWKESEGCAELKGKLAKGCPFIAIMGDDD